MSDKTKIEWADATANFWIGCTKVSAACDHCYAEADWDKRKHRVTWGPHGDRSKCAAGASVVRKMQRGAAAFIAQHGHKPRIFVNSLSDWADNHKSILPQWRAEIFQLARECPDVILMLLTKRSQNIAKMLPADWGNGYPNVWLGTTAENQEEYNRRKPNLVAVPAVVHFLSMEPLLGRVDMGDMAGIDWVIVGGESGPKARPMHPYWARSLRDQCAAAGVAFHFKQCGEWGLDCGPDQNGSDPIMNGQARCAVRVGDNWQYFANGYEPSLDLASGNGEWVYRLGKKRAGRLLDGAEHSEFPA